MVRKEKYNIFIHPTSIVEADYIGEGTYIGPFCYIKPRVRIGRNCTISSHCIIGGVPQYKIIPPDIGGSIVIEDNVIIREFSSIILPTADRTYIGYSSYIMTHTNISHDVYIGHDAIIGIGCTLAGFTTIGNHCYLGINSATHQYAKMEDYCLLGGSSFFKGESPKGITWGGVPSKPIKPNFIGINRNAPEEERQNIIVQAENFIKNYL